MLTMTTFASGPLFTVVGSPSIKCPHTWFDESALTGDELQKAVGVADLISGQLEILRLDLQSDRVRDLKPGFDHLMHIERQITKASDDSTTRVEPIGVTGYYLSAELLQILKDSPGYKVHFERKTSEASYETGGAVLLDPGQTGEVRILLDSRVTASLISSGPFPSYRALASGNPVHHITEVPIESRFHPHSSTCTKRAIKIGGCAFYERPLVATAWRSNQVVIILGYVFIKRFVIRVGDQDLLMRDPAGVEGAVRFERVENIAALLDDTPIKINHRGVAWWQSQQPS